MSRPTAPEQAARGWEDILHQHRTRNNLPAQARASQIQSLTRFAVVLAIFVALSGPAMADQQERPFSFQLPKNDSAAAESLASQVAALSPRVNREEAKLLAECAYATASQLRKEHRMFGTPIFNNFLVHWGIRKRGYCFQWAEDLLIALDALKLASLELHWDEAHAGNWQENNCIVVTAKGHHSTVGSLWTAGGILDIYAVVRFSARLIRTSKTLRTCASSAPDQPRTLSTLIIQLPSRRVS
jgi:hypothetical protein